MLDPARRAGVQRVILNGSFVTDIIEPNDVDCALLFDPLNRRDVEAFETLGEGLPFLDIKLTEQEEFDDFVNSVYATDRKGMVKGMVELIV